MTPTDLCVLSLLAVGVLLSCLHTEPPKPRKHVWLVEGRHTYLYVFDEGCEVEIAFKLYCDFKSDLISWGNFDEGVRQLGLRRFEIKATSGVE